MPPDGLRDADGAEAGLLLPVLCVPAEGRRGYEDTGQQVAACGCRDVMSLNTRTTWQQSPLALLNKGREL